MQIYPNTPIIDETVSTNLAISYFFGNLLLPLAMILYVLLYFRDDKNIYIYAILMAAMFLTVPSWFIVVSGLALIGLDKASKWAKEKKSLH